jgi:hypothetical protein
MKTLTKTNSTKVLRPSCHCEAIADGRGNLKTNDSRLLRCARNDIQNALIKYNWYHIILVFAVIILATANSSLAQNMGETERRTVTISGSAGLEGVEMTGLPGNPTTDSSGNYKSIVPVGFKGTVTPRKEGYVFTPPFITYNNITTNLNNQNHKASVLHLTISGNVGVAGVRMLGLPGEQVTDSHGAYGAAVPYGWSGTVTPTPTKQGYKFEPAARTYGNITSDVKQDYVPVASPAVSPANTDARKVVVIPASQSKAGDFASTTEDVRVMLHILDQKLIDEPSTIRGILTDYGDIFGRENLSSKAVYIQGYGVLFLMEVNFPLVAADQLQPKPEQPVEKNADTVWQQAKEQVFSPRDGTATRPRSQIETMRARVERLKNELIETMKHASNIRQIEPNQWVIYNVTGISQSSIQQRNPYGTYGATKFYMYGAGGTLSPTDAPTGYGGTGVSGNTGYGGGYSATGYGAGTYDTTVYGSGYGPPPADTLPVVLPSSEVLTIRAKKADVDAFAKGQLSMEQFRQKINMFTY